MTIKEVCAQNGVGTTVRKPYADGRRYDAKRRPFGVPVEERMEQTAALMK